MKKLIGVMLVMELFGCRSTAPVPVQQETSGRAKKPSCAPACEKDETCVARKTYEIGEDGSSVAKEYLCFKTSELVGRGIVRPSP